MKKSEFSKEFINIIKISNKDPFAINKLQIELGSPKEIGIGSVKNPCVLVGSSRVARKNKRGSECLKSQVSASNSQLIFF